MILQLRAQNWERMQIEFYSRMHKIGNKMQKPQGFWHTPGLKRNKNKEQINDQLCLRQASSAFDVRCLLLSF